MYRNDYPFCWKPGHKYLKAENFVGVSGTPVESQVNSLGAKSIQMNTNADTVGLLLDASEWPDYDPQWPVEVNVRWSTGSTTAADTVVWKVFVKPINHEGEAIAAAATALSETIASDTVGSTTAYTLRTSPTGRLNPYIFDRDERAVMIGVEMDAKAAGLAEALHFLGLDIQYTPRKMQGPDGMRDRAKEGSLPWLINRDN